MIFIFVYCVKENKMRMWMVNTNLMCNQHLLGEHCECHMFLGTLKKGLHLDGYVDKNCLELSSLKKRHDLLANEMILRGMNHKTPLNYPNSYSFGQSKYVKRSKVNKKKSYLDLIFRCKECKKRINNK